MTADLCEAELPILIALHLLGKCNVTVSEVHCLILFALHLLEKCNVAVSEEHCLNFNRIWSCAKRKPNFNRIVRDPGFYARPKRFPRPGVKHVRKMISGVTEVLDQP